MKDPRNSVPPPAPPPAPPRNGGVDQTAMLWVLRLWILATLLIFCYAICNWFLNRLFGTT